MAGFAGAFGSGLRSVIAADPELSVVDVGELPRVRAVMAKHRPNVLFLNETALPDAMELRRIVITYPATEVVVGVLDLNRDRVQAFLGAGARIVIPLTTNESELRAALRLVARGLVGPPRITAAAGPDGLALLTDRETEVFELLLRRFTAREIAETLHIATSTVNAHTRRIYDKLGVHSRIELAEAVRSPSAEDVHDSQVQVFTRDRVSLVERTSEARSDARPSPLDMRAAMGLARWRSKSD
ncbi:MAG TPA: response regulator transcription factor [Solirubrobacteraceae bacterium]|nr:response regulator transcription factor [Solirubrobacteraceae bacterium]